MKPGTVLLSLSILLASLFFSEKALAKQFVLQNATGVKVSVVLVVPTNRGWMAVGWYTVAPYSYKRVNLSWAGGDVFGYYAHGGGLSWRGKGNAPTIEVPSSAFRHPANARPGYGKRVQVRMVRGNSIKLTGAARQSRGGGYW